MKKWIACLLVLALALPLGSAWAEGYDPDHLTVASPTALSGNFFTDMWGNNTSDMDVRSLIHGYSLVRWDAEIGRFDIDSSVVSGIAVADDLDTGDRTYTISLYNDLKFSDGSMIGAKDYVFSLLFCAAPHVKALGAAVNGMDAVVGVNQFKIGAAKTVTGVRLLGEREFSVTVKGDSLPNFYELAVLNIIPYPISQIAPGCEIKDDGQGAYIGNANRAQVSPLFTVELLKKTVLDGETGYLSHPAVVSGPYKLTSFDGETAEFEINPYYKGDAQGRKGLIQRITFTHVDNNQIAAKLESGEIDLVNKVVSAQSIADAQALTAAGTAQEAGYGREGFSFISFCCESQPMASQKVRQALSYALDKDALVAAYVGDNGQRVDGYYGAGQWMYRVVTGQVDAPVTALSAEATTAEKAAQTQETKAWAALNLDNVRVYNLDLEAAEALLIADGWTMNPAGADFVKGTDTVRCKRLDGQLVALDLTLLYPAGNAIGDALQTAFADNLAQIGVKVTLEAKPMQELLRIYYRQDVRDCDMIYLATNFDTVFDPAQTFAPDDAHQGVNNRTGIVDPLLYQLAADMRKTAPADVLGYVTKWVAFQERFQEVAPLIPVYSNTYYDFFSIHLQNYAITENTSWARAILGAALTDVQ